MTNAERFLIAFNTIEKHLRRITLAQRGLPFYKLVDRASKTNSAVRNYSIDLKEYADLRNAIVHERTDEHVIAEPNESSVKKIEKLASLIQSPPPIKSFMSRNVLGFEARQSIGIIVKSLYDRNFSQAPIYDGSVYIGLLTTDTIARWLGANVNEDIFSLSDTTASEVLAFTEDPTSAVFQNPNTSVFEVLECYQERNIKGKRIDAILITQSGEPNEKLLGILTIWDLPQLHKAVAI